MAKRWKVTVEEWDGSVACSSTEVLQVGYKPAYAQYLDTLDLEELILFVNRMEATKK